MPVDPRIRRQKLLREAEGYLGLLSACHEKWSAEACFKDRLARRAIAALAELDPSDSQDAYVLYLRGHALRDMERYAEAIEPLRAAAEIEPENIATWVALGWCHKRTGRLDLAIEALEEALSADAEQAIVHYNLACYWSLAHNADAALAFLANAFEIDPSYRRLVANERDFDPIREHPSFLELTSVVV